MKHLYLPHIFIWFIPLLFTSCRESVSTTASPAFNTIYKKFDHFNYTDELKQSLDSVVSLYPNLEFTDKFNYYSYECGYYHVARHNDIKALSYTDSLLMLVTVQKDDPSNNATRQASANLARGGILFSLKKYNSALQFFYDSKVAADKSGDSDVISDLNYNLGMVMFRKLNYRAAAGYFSKAFRQPWNNEPFTFDKFYRMQEVLCNVAESYIMANEPDSAVLYSDSARFFITANENFYPGKEQLISVAKAVIEGATGEAYLLKNDAVSGEKLLRESVAINSKPGYDKGNAVQMQLQLAKFYLDKGFDSIQPAKVSDLLAAIEAGLDTIRNEEDEVKWNYLMSRYYDIMNDPAAALAYLKKGNEYDKKTEGENKTLSETNVGAYFQVMQNQYEMQLLKKNSDIQKIYLTIAISLFVFFGIIILLIWRYWQQSKKHVTVLTRLHRKVKQQKKKLEQVVAALNKRSEEKNHILKVIAHDLRNPVSAINALSRLLKDDPTLDEEQTDCLNLINTASVESLELIDAIMQIEDNNGQQETEKQLYDINKLILTCVKQLTAPAAEKNLFFTVDLPAEQQLALVNTDKIQRVIKNLLTNAIKFSHKGNNIQISVAGKENSIIVKIEDHGIGIPESMKDKIFDMFTEARRRGTEDEKTFGLGLSICKQFVEAHGGTIWFKSKENEGTSFYIKLKKEDVIQNVPNYEEALSS